MPMENRECWRGIQSQGVYYQGFVLYQLEDGELGA